MASAETVSQSSSTRAARSRRSAPARSQSNSVGVADQDLAEILAGAEDLQEDLGRPRVRRQLVERLVEPADGGEEAFEVRQRHAGVGAPRQDGVELHGDPRDPVEPLGPGAPGEVDQVRAPALGVADAQAREPALSNSGISW